jgi:coenzyme F420-0:L-glutamate ligase / coenzyme F420-1:gamma-L-glutamate ligase
VASRAELRVVSAEGDNERAPSHGDLAELIKTRRSIRHFRPGAIPRHIVRELLEAAARAPSPHNRQPWRFAVLSGRSAKARLAQAMGERLHADRSRDGDPAAVIEVDVARSRARIEGAPVVLVAALSMRDMDRYPDERRSHAEDIVAVHATAAAVQNMLLLAHARGLGACWMCAPLFCPEIVREALGLPADWQPQALITIGKPDGAGRDRDRADSNETSIWFEESEN